MALWHRRAGKDLVAMNWTVRSAFQRPGLYWHVLPTYEQGRKIVWNGMTGAGRRFLDHWPPGTIKRRRDDMMLVETIPLGPHQDGSIWQVVGTDDPDRLVGANPVGCVFSEYSIQNPRAWDLVRPILNENGGWALFIYTARGRNHGFDMFTEAMDNPNWFAELLTVDDTAKPATDPMTGKELVGPDGGPIMVPVVTEDDINDDRRMGMPEEVVLQEYWNSFDAPLVGSYYSAEMSQAQEDGRIGDVPWNPNLRVETWWDIGIGKRDANAVWFVQETEDGWLNCIDYEEGTGKGFPAWVKILEAKPYTYSMHIAPHDFNHKEYMGGHKRIDVARRQFDMEFTLAPKTEVSGFSPDGINAVRAELHRCRFNARLCKQGIEALRQYSKKVDAKKQNRVSDIIFSDTPNHNWASHGADAFRTGVTGRGDPKRRARRAKNRQLLADSEYDILSGAESDMVRTHDGRMLPMYADDGLDF